LDSRLLIHILIELLEKLLYLWVLLMLGAAFLIKDFLLGPFLPCFQVQSSSPNILLPSEEITASPCEGVLLYQSELVHVLLMLLIVVHELLLDLLDQLVVLLYLPLVHLLFGVNVLELLVQFVQELLLDHLVREISVAHALLPRLVIVFKSFEPLKGL